MSRVLVQIRLCRPCNLIFLVSVIIRCATIHMADLMSEHEVISTDIYTAFKGLLFVFHVGQYREAINPARTKSGNIRRSSKSRALRSDLSRPSNLICMASVYNIYTLI